MWTRSSEVQETDRNKVRLDFLRSLKAAGIIWFCILLANAIGAGVAANGDPFGAPLFVMLGIGFGVAMSLGIGLLACKLGPDHQFKLHAHCWLKAHWMLHAPWLSIAAFTIVGSVLALISRLFSEAAADSIMMVTVVISLICWAIVSLGGLIMFFSSYAERRSQLGVEGANTVVTIHVLYALLVWLGSVFVGFLGGILGTFFMVSIADIWMGDF